MLSRLRATAELLRWAATEGQLGEVLLGMLIWLVIYPLLRWLFRARVP